MEHEADLVAEGARRREGGPGLRICKGPPAGLPYIIVSGVISPADNLASFWAAVSANQVHVVTFDSPGGDLAKARPQVGQVIL